MCVLLLSCFAFRVCRFVSVVDFIVMCCSFVLYGLFCAFVCDVVFVFCCFCVLCVCVVASCVLLFLFSCCLYCLCVLTCCVVVCFAGVVSCILVCCLCC